MKDEKRMKFRSFEEFYDVWRRKNEGRNRAEERIRAIRGRMKEMGEKKKKEKEKIHDE